MIFFTIFFLRDDSSYYSNSCTTVFFHLSHRIDQLAEMLRLHARLSLLKSMRHLFGRYPTECAAFL
ncbi:Uncharacterised protein [Vibrio cholerae]|nr:Uncharacterised protein [Vibrio cholerae]CSC03260.1 Uncharacterised protein [Vibrio cholerae]